MRTGKRLRAEGVELVYREKMGPRVKPEDDTKTYRFAFVVSTKVSKLAVVRNRTRRLMSEAVRLWLKSIGVAPSIDGIFVARKELTLLTQEEVQKKVTELLGKIS